MTRATTFVAACLQLRSGRDLAANIDHVAPLMREAAGAGATFIQTPEMTNIVERDRKNLFAQVDVETNDPVVAALRELARELRVDLHIGSVAVRVDGHGDRLANRGLLVSREGEVTARYDKIHLFDVDLPSGQSWRESNTYSGGREAVVAPLPWGGLGLSICYDVRFPALYHALAVEGADVLTAPSCFTRETGEAHWSVLQRARAIECGAWMISRRAGRPARGWPRDVGTFDHRRSMGPRGGGRRRRARNRVGGDRRGGGRRRASAHSRASRREALRGLEQQRRRRALAGGRVTDLPDT